MDRLSKIIINELARTLEPGKFVEKYPFLLQEISEFPDLGGLKRGGRQWREKFPKLLVNKILSLKSVLHLEHAIGKPHLSDKRIHLVRFLNLYKFDKNFGIERVEFDLKKLRFKLVTGLKTFLISRHALHRMYERISEYELRKNEVSFRIFINTQVLLALVFLEEDSALREDGKFFAAAREKKLSWAETIELIGKLLQNSDSNESVGEVGEGDVQIPVRGGVLFADYFDNGYIIKTFISDLQRKSDQSESANTESINNIERYISDFMERPGPSKPGSRSDWCEFSRRGI